MPFTIIQAPFNFVAAVGFDSGGYASPISTNWYNGGGQIISGLTTSYAGTNLNLEPGISINGMIGDGGGITNLNALNIVATNKPSAGNALRYDGTNFYWAN